jgi:hypothetical protein
LMAKKRERRQGQRRPDGKTCVPKEVCPRCRGQGITEYLVTAWKTKNKKWVRIGLVCPSDDCDYIVKDKIESSSEWVANGPKEDH